MEYSTIQKKSEQELFNLINDLKAELFLLRFKNKTGRQDQTHKIKLVRRDIAKVLTALKNVNNEPVIKKSSKKTKEIAKPIKTKEVNPKKIVKTKDKEVK